jgi:hypothetical protein
LRQQMSAIWSLCRAASMRAFTQRSGSLLESLSRLAQRPFVRLLSGIDRRKDARGIARTLSGQPDILPSSSPLFSVKDAGRPTSVRFEATDLTSVHAAKSVVNVSSAGKGLVVSLTTQSSHQFYSGGVLNHNCDALQYLCLGTESRALAIQLRSTTIPQRPPLPEPSALAWS